MVTWKPIDTTCSPWQMRWLPVDFSSSTCRRDKYNGRTTDKIRTKMPHDWPHDIAVWQNGRLDRGSVLLLGHWSAHFFLVLAWAPVTIQHCKRSRGSRNGHVRNFNRQDVDVAGVWHGQTGPGPPMALLICDVWAAESTKVSFAPWNLFAGMGTSENQHTHVGLQAMWWTIMLRAININGVVIDVARTSAIFIRGQTRSWS